MRITDVVVACSKCGWVGRIENTEPDVDGDGNLGCPDCFTKKRVEIVKEITDQSDKMN